MQLVSNINTEKVHLKQTLDLIGDNISYLEKITKKAFDEMVEAHEKYSPESPEYYMDIPVKENLYDMFKTDLEITKKAYNNPYFGKIIFDYKKESDYKGLDKRQELYIGKSGISDKKSMQNNQVVIDWRAPVSEVYYSSKLGQSAYVAPKGEIDIELLLKTTFKIKNKEIESMFDAEVVSNDDLLVEYLSQNKDTVLNEIIATIQEEQNKIIRMDLKKNLVVQGVAGSGKTTVALHRISYLLYNFKEELKANNVYLIASNKLFLQYITSMLPDLDVPIIKQGTMDEILQDTLNQFDYKYKFKYNKLSDSGNFYENDFTKNVNYFFKDVSSELFCEDTITMLDFTFLNNNQINYYVKNDDLSLLQKAELMDKLMNENIKNQKENIIKYLFENKNVSEVRECILKILKIEENNIFLFSIRKNFAKITAYFNHYYVKKIKKLNALQLFYNFTNNKTKGDSLNDFACFLLFMLKIYGIKENNIFKDIKHIVIDEAQDFNVVIYECLRKLFNHATFTIVGDVMQNIYNSGLHTWDEVIPILGVKTEKINMHKSYRNTIEISNFAKKIMEKVTNEDFHVEPIVRHGNTVNVFSDSSESKNNKIVELLNEYKGEEKQLNAIICKEEITAEKVYKQLQNKLDIKKLDVNEGSLEHGSYVISVKNSKGLEFDNVIIYDFDEYSQDVKKLDYKKLYVAMTRALHNLTVFSNKDL